MSTVAPSAWRIRESSATTALPNATPVAVAVAGADALSSLSIIVGGTFWAAYEFAGRGRTGVIVGLATVPVVGLGLYLFGRWYSTARVEETITTTEDPS